MNALILTDLTFGDAGKGSLTDYYARLHNAHTVIRHNGGAQAAHNVHTQDGRHHTFAQFGSGTFAGAATHLSRFMLVDPVALLAEEEHLRTLNLRDAFEKLTIDPRATLVSPFQRAANRLRELQRGKDRHGSCGMGIGETMADRIAHQDNVLYAADLANPARTLEKLNRIRQDKLSQMLALDIPPSDLAAREWAILGDPHAPKEFAALFLQVAQKIKFACTAEILAQKGTVIFEGAQGVLLDEWHGFHPHTTWSTTTFENAMTLLAESNIPRQNIRRIGALRAYMTRHGPGPFPTFDPSLTRALPDSHNIHNPWQRDFRVGWPDMVMLRYALHAAGGADELAVTCLDRIAHLDTLNFCNAYETLGENIAAMPAPNLDHQEKLTRALAATRPIYKKIPRENLLTHIQHALQTPITLTSRGRTHLEKKPTHPPQAHLTPSKN